MTYFLKDSGTFLFPWQHTVSIFHEFMLFSCFAIHESWTPYQHVAHQDHHSSHQRCYYYPYSHCCHHVVQPPVPNLKITFSCYCHCIYTPWSCYWLIDFSFSVCYGCIKGVLRILSALSSPWLTFITAFCSLCALPKQWWGWGHGELPEWLWMMISLSSVLLCNTLPQPTDLPK